MSSTPSLWHRAIEAAVVAMAVGLANAVVHALTDSHTANAAGMSLMAGAASFLRSRHA